jgi:tetratricopeptide (TPR) repeat protein
MKAILCTLVLSGGMLAQEPPVPPQPQLPPEPSSVVVKPLPPQFEFDGGALEAAAKVMADIDLAKLQAKLQTDMAPLAEARAAMADAAIRMKMGLAPMESAKALAAADAELARLKFGTFEFAKGPTGPMFKDFGMAFQNRDRAAEIAEREYERGSRALDKRQWDEAAARFTEVVATGKSKADGALYWKAYALSKLGRSQEATASLDELAKTYPQSRWLNDAKALRVEVAQAAGKPVSPENTADDDIKLMALNALMQSDPERSIPLLEKILQTQSSPKLRERALFVLSQSDSPKAREAVVRVAKGGANPDLQLKAVRSLGIYGGKENRQYLSDIYSSTNDIAVKKQVLNSFMTSGERDRILAVAKSEPNVDLRKEAIHYLGTMGANSQLAEMYTSETSTEIRARILQAMFVSGNTTKLIEIAKTEKDPELRKRAIHHLGTSGGQQATDALVAIYGSATDAETKKRVLEALFVQGSARQIVEVARKETDPELKKQAVQRLSHMQSKEALDFLMELVNK